MTRSYQSTELHSAFVAAVHKIREAFGKADIGRFEFRIQADGRTMTDRAEIKIEYYLESSYGCHVKGNELDEVIRETLRRNGWDESNLPKALPCP